MPGQATGASTGDEAPESSTKPRFQQASLDILDEAHQETLVCAISRVASTGVAEMTFAQIVDGLPVARVLEDTYGICTRAPREHPVWAHEELCPGTLERTREIRSNFRPDALKFDSRLLFAFQAAAPGSRAFNTRLIELVAVAVHQVAVVLFKMDTSLHKDDGIAKWVPPKDDWLYWEYYPGDPPPLLSHPWYGDPGQYPDGAADVAGYWAEDRILGGVVLFDRRKVGADPEAIYLHPGCDTGTYRICQLLPGQKQALLSFLTAPELPAADSVPIPMTLTADNAVRVDPEEPIAKTGIYRDIWERKELPLSAGDARLKDVWDTTDYPTLADKNAAYARALDRQQRYYKLGDDNSGDGRG